MNYHPGMLVLVQGTLQLLNSTKMVFQALYLGKNSVFHPILFIQLHEESGIPNRYYTKKQIMFEWHQNLSVNIAEIDEQHKKLLALMKNVYEAVRDGQSSKDIESHINELLRFALMHFDTEEKLMEQNGFPGLDMHRKAHFNLTMQAMEFKERNDKGTEKISLDIIDFIGEWIMTHILKADKEFSAFLIDKGVR
jgi:hemerythrin